MQTAADKTIACTLDGAALQRRLAWIRRVTDRHLLSHRLDGTVLRLTYRGAALSDLEQIVAQERDCCAFMRYSLERLPDAVMLTIDAPRGAGTDARWLFEQFQPSEQLRVSGKGCGCGPLGCG